MRETMRVRYSECDMQRVVHNAVYLAWCDDVADRFFRACGATLEDNWWDVMVKSATVTWSSPAHLNDEVEIEAAVSRWGRSSFDVGFAGTIGERLVFEATITYVAIRTGTLDTVEVPEDFRTVAGAV